MATTLQDPEESSAWVEVSGDGYEPDLRFIDVKPAHMAVVAAILGREMTEEDTELLSEEGTGAYAGIWTDANSSEHWIGVAGPDAEAIAGRAAATAEYLGARVTVLVGEFTYDEINGAVERIAALHGVVPFQMAWADIKGNRAVVVVDPDDQAAMAERIADLPDGLVTIESPTAPPEG